MLQKSVMVGMSGGVDSTVAAALLKEQGYKVIGVTLKLWDDDRQESYNKTCCSLEDIDDARNAAYDLGIPYYVLNFKDLFSSEVVGGFVNSYLEGYTPNPCIVCNQKIKFEAMLKKALSMDIDYIATGHYVRKEFDSTKGRYVLKKGLDGQKDQSYVLYMLSQEQLERSLFPLGTYTKVQVRKIAEQLNLKISNKPDSQDICFVGNGDYADFIMKHTDQKIKPGPFKDTEGRTIGTHQGLIRYTVGQRKGLGAAFGRPMYVIEKRKEDNSIVLGTKEEAVFGGLVAEQMNYILFDNPDEHFEANVKVRYHAKEAKAVITPMEDNKAEILFEEPQPYVAPGQAVVLYKDDYVVGGGTITKSLRRKEVEP
ncbi:MAG: tRNA 2-thiouridine(34) synthase MnmA [Clostridiaceae bacterium]|nr:tRNA 2-thiouridine(34) synthase MnmA [Clostridiaceae bacterium]